MKRPAAAALLSAAVLAGGAASAGDFDALGVLHASAEDVAFEGFEQVPDRYILAEMALQFPQCIPSASTPVTQPDALEGEGYVRLDIQPNCAERYPVKLPAEQASYRASLWTRHGAIVASFVVTYPPDSGRNGVAALLSPTGRTTSDGWVELASNPFPVDGAAASHTYLKVISYAARDGVDIDAFEVVRDGAYIEESDCSGVGDPVCGPLRVCIWNRCVLGQAALPVLPSDLIRDDVVDVFASQLRLFYGGHRSRAIYLPAALAILEDLRSAESAWSFWSGWAAAIHALHDWHTATNMAINGLVQPRRRLNACFIEGDADLSHDVWPKDARFADILVSHAGPDAAGLKAGDRLLAVDGRHPIEWAASLGQVNWGFHVATDPNTFSDFPEALGGPSWGGALILQFAHELTVLRCDESGACNGALETIQVTDLGNSGKGQDVSCDNRPFYHFAPEDNPDPANHHVYGRFFQGAIAGTSPDEAIFGMVWDTLNGEGYEDSPVNQRINDAVADWKAHARGVILDHRAGNGGTLDAVTNLTKLVRPEEVIAVFRAPMEIAGYDGPFDKAEGLAIFDEAKYEMPFHVGAPDWAEGLPVALVLHRDGSASDFLPYGMKGAPNVRIFGPHQTSGAFSTFIEYVGWGNQYYQIASGETIGADGSALIGHGVMPDVVLLPKQSDLIAGKDTLFEAALAWVRKELEP